MGLGSELRDFAVPWRCMRLAAGLPAAALLCFRSLGGLTAAYDDVVAPVVHATIADPAERDRVDGALRAMSTKIGLVMLSYARLVGREPSLPVAALAGAVTRLYDDLIDSDADATLDERLGDLFGARLFVPHRPAEDLLGRLVYDIAHRVGSRLDEAMFMALTSLHEYQCRSRRQRDAQVPQDVLEKITRGKGAMAHTVLCRLVAPELDADEQELVAELGDALQSVDDYMDVAEDRHNGVTTLVSAGAVTFPDIELRLRELRPRLVARYGRTATRPYCGVIYFLLLKAVMGRRLPAVGRVVRRVAERSALLDFLTRGNDALPPAVRTAGRARVGRAEEKRSGEAQ